MKNLHPLFRSKIRLMTLVSVVFVAQCCCCFLPIGFRTGGDLPQSRQVIETIQYNFDLLFKGADGTIYFSK